MNIIPESITHNFCNNSDTEEHNFIISGSDDSAGDASEHPLFIEIETPSESGFAGEYACLQSLFGTIDVDFKILSRYAIPKDGSVYDVFDIKLASGTTFQLNFDITDFFGRR